MNSMANWLSHGQHNPPQHGQAQAVQANVSNNVSNNTNQQLAAHYNNYQNQAQNAQGQAYGVTWPPPLQFEENVPDDELEFLGKLSRWSYGALMSGAMVGGAMPQPVHSISCCQRMLML
jgi:hypothetical protein